MPDDALEAVERENSKLKGFIEKNRYARLEIPQQNLGGLIDLIATIPFEHADLHAKDNLGQFALAEGKKGGQYFTPKSIVSLIVEMLEPYQGRVCDPAMGSGGFFVQSERFIKEHSGRLGNLSVYGQESNPTTWRLAAMNMAIRGIDFYFGKEPANSFINDQHPDLRADYVMANPPFNIKQWWDGKLEGDPRWRYGTPPKGNANFAWVQHMLHHLAPNGYMALLLANGSMSSSTGGAGPPFQKYVRAHAVHGATVDRISLKGFPRYPCLLPSDEMLTRFEAIASSCWSRIHSNQRESRTLTQLRDTLLPKPLSGELTAPAAETKPRMR